MCGILALFCAPDGNGDLRAELLALSKVCSKCYKENNSWALVSAQVR